MMRWAAMIMMACIFVAPVSSGKQNDFDLVCSYFTELESRLGQEPMVADQKRLFIHARVSDNLSSDSEARIAWEMVVVAEASVIYTLFVQAAAAAGVPNWQCPVMNKLSRTF